jgi:hypothetical protein
MPGIIKSAMDAVSKLTNKSLAATKGMKQTPRNNQIADGLDAVYDSDYREHGVTVVSTTSPLAHLSLSACLS